MSLEHGRAHFAPIRALFTTGATARLLRAVYLSHRGGRSRHTSRGPVVAAHRVQEHHMAALTASQFGSLGDGAPLHLPMPGLFADIESGSGAVALTDEFLDAPPAIRVDVLQHWICLLYTSDAADERSSV